MSKLQTSDFFYNLPQELIAQEPLANREASRLLVLDKKSGKIKHDNFYNIASFLKAGDVLVLNNSKVFPARLKAKKKISGGKLEIFLHKKIDEDILKNTWHCLLKGKVKLGLDLVVSNKLSAKVININDDSTFLLEFNLKGHDFWTEINKIGEVRLPPYIKREMTDSRDKERYQTVYAKNEKIGSVAAPTAGLHFSPEVLEGLKKKGIKIKQLTLHVGLGTFLPLKVENLKDHKMHSEYLEISKDTIKAVLEAKKLGSRVVAVGTTSCRALEALASCKPGNINILSSKYKLETKAMWTDIFIYPGYKFKLVDALITNFHLPKSSLLMLVSALASKKHIDRAYQVAVEESYRFFSYGDAMLII